MLPPFLAPLSDKRHSQFRVFFDLIGSLGAVCAEPKVFPMPAIPAINRFYVISNSGSTAGIHSTVGTAVAVIWVEHHIDGDIVVLVGV